MSILPWPHLSACPKSCLKAFLTVCTLICAVFPATAQDTARVDWEVVNPFRFFTDAQDTARHKQAYRWLTEEERRTPVLSIERKLAARDAVGWAARLQGATCWDKSKNRHRCPKDANYVHPKSHTISAALLHAPDLGTGICQWSVRTLKRSHRRRKSVRAKVLRVEEPCNTRVKLKVQYPAGASVTVRKAGRVIARQIIKVRDLFIVGMGDSFGSGEGNPDVPVRFSNKRTADYGLLAKSVPLTGYPARAGRWGKIGDRLFLNSGAKWLDQACHRSLYSHQLRAALQLAIENPHRSVTFVGVACSGAEITAGLFRRYKGNEWVRNPPDLSQISAIAQAQCGRREAQLKDYPEAFHERGRIEDLRGIALRKCPSRFARRIDLVFLSIGGNDIGFARLVANAVLRDRTVLRRLGGWFGQVYDPDDVAAPMSELALRYKALNRAMRNVLHLPWDRSGADRVILTAYPGMALLEDGRVCPSSRLGMDVLPQYALNATRALEGEKVGDKLHSMMRKAAKDRGWRLVDAHRRKFQGRGICAGHEFTAANELRLPRKVDGYWQPYSPANFEPYATRQRWFRTPNDAFMTGNFHVKGTILRQLLRSRRLQWTQLLLASTYSGAFHPTAEGQAAIADALVQEARKALGEG